MKNYRKSTKHRGRISPRKSKRLFTKTAKGAHPKNSLRQKPMRGGIRL